MSNQQIVVANNGAPHKSTTTLEQYFHYRVERDKEAEEAGSEAEYTPRQRFIVAATAFARIDKDNNWYVAIAECDHRDQFDRRVGRNIARRKWFNGKRELVGIEAGQTRPTYEQVFKDYLS